MRGRDTLMATSEAVRDALMRKRDQRQAMIEAAHKVLEQDGSSATDTANALRAGVAEMVHSWRDDADMVEHEARRGWKTRAEFLRQCAAEAAGFVGELASVVSAPRALEATAAPATPEADHVEQIKDFLSGKSDVLPDAKVRHDTQIPTFVDPPNAPKRMTWSEFAEAVDALPEVDHASFSSITSIADCGIAYALGKILPETPAWWNVGGTAFHQAVEDWERQIFDRPEDVAAISPDALPGILEEGWAKALDLAIEAQKAETPDVPEHEWRIANKGLENYDWWRVNGADMLKRYVAYWAPKRAEGWKIYTMPGGQAALELELSLDVDGRRFDVIIDQVWQRPDRSLFIPDLKSGKSTPASTFQLGGAAWALTGALGLSYATIGGGFYVARQGSHDLETADLLAAHSWDEMRHKVRSFFAMRNAKAFLPRVSNFGGGCSSCGFKTICPARG